MCGFDVATATTTARDRWALRVLLCVIGAVLLAYALMVPGPTRMMNDTVSYFLRAHELLTRGGLASDNPRVSHPAGYSIVLAGMIRLGMDSVWWFIALNVLSLGVALVLLVPLCRRAFGLSDLAIAWCLVFFLLSWTVVKHVPMLYSELLYLAISVAILWLLICARPRPWWGRVLVFLIAAALTVMLVLIRTIGLAMLPALAWYGVRQYGGAGAIKRRALRDTPSKLVAGSALVLVAAALAYKAVTYDLEAGSRYVSMMVHAYTERTGEVLVQVVNHRLLEAGKLAMNLPERALPGSLHFTFLPVGLAVYVLGAAGFWMQRHRVSLVHVYLFGFLALQLPWLSYDARFWLPVMPMLIPVLVDPLVGLSRRAPRWSPRLGLAYAVCFCGVGAIALGMGLRNTYAGRDYARYDLWFPGELRVAYGLAERDDFELLDLDAIDLIRRYDPYTPASQRLTGIPAPHPPPDTKTKTRIGPSPADAPPQ